jgi:hypothetical protein
MAAIPAERLSPGARGASSSSASAAAVPADYSADRISGELEYYMYFPCDHTYEAEIGGVFYYLCTLNDGLNGERPFRASVSDPDIDSTENYWFRETGEPFGVQNRVRDITIQNYLGEDGQTVIRINEQRELELYADVNWWNDLADDIRRSVARIEREIQSAPPSTSIWPHDIPMAVVKLPRRGGDFQNRWPTFEVPVSDTSESVNGGEARWYDLHIAMMVAMTADQFCNEPSDRGAYFNYEADGGRIYMGQIFIRCSFAVPVMEEFGRDRYTWVMFEEAGLSAEPLDQWIPELTDAVMPEFRRTVVSQLTPECNSGAEPLCPGDRI